MSDWLIYSLILQGHKPLVLSHWGFFFLELFIIISEIQKFKSVTYIE